MAFYTSKELKHASVFVPHGEELTAFAADGEWLHVQWKEQRGFVKRRNVRLPGEQLRAPGEKRRWGRGRRRHEDQGSTRYKHEARLASAESEVIRRLQERIHKTGLRPQLADLVTRVGARTDATTSEEHSLLPSDQLPSPVTEESADEEQTKGISLKQNIDRLLGTRYSEEELARLKSQTLNEIELWLGKEMLTSDSIEHALLVKRATLDTCLLGIATLFTCGLYWFFRPMKDCSMLVLTKTGRVLLVNRIHHSFWGLNPGANTWAMLRYFLILLLFSILPFSLMLLLWAYGKNVQNLLGNPDIFSYKAFVANQAKIYMGILFFFWLAFLCWVWVNRQRGFGTRFRREFKAVNIAAAQYTLVDNGGFCNCCLRRRRRSSLRLFFGKYPKDTELDELLPTSMLDNHAAVPQRSAAGESLSVQMDSVQPSGTEGSANEEQQATRYFPCISFVLLVCSILSQCLAFHGYYSEFLLVGKAHEFCVSARTPSECTPAHCREFAHEHEFRRNGFCDHVGWTHGESLLCNAEGVSSCCSRCMSGEFLDYIGYDDPDVWMESGHSVLSYFVLFLALFTSGVSMSFAFNRSQETSTINVDYVQDFYNSDSNTFAMKTELAIEFLKRVFQDGKEEDVPYEDATGDSDPGGGGRIECVDKEGAPHWFDFFSSGHHLVRPGSAISGEATVVRVPKQCLGFMENEKVIKAWAEMAYMSTVELYYLMVASIVLGVLLVYWPPALGGPLISFGFDEQCSTQSAKQSMARVMWCMTIKPLLVMITGSVALPLVVCFRHFWFYKQQQCAVIVTTHRIFTVYYRPDLFSSLPFQPCEPSVCLRVEAFRHDSEVFYGRMTSSRPFWFTRLCSFCPWRTGDILVQSKFGILKLTRHSGNVEPIFDVITTAISSDCDDLNLDDAYAGVSLPLTYGVSGDAVVVDLGEEGFAHVRWTSAVPGDPNPEKFTTIAREGGLTGKEEPLFIWSFLESGSLTSPYNIFNSVVVTTDRIRLQSQIEYKEFDCRTWLCWGFFHCACLRRLWDGTSLPTVKAFLNFTHMSAFSTETTVLPTSVPVRCPQYNTLCDMLTNLTCCTLRNCPAPSNCFECPSTAPPLIQIWLKWMPKYVRATPQDLVLSLKPYTLQEISTEEAGLYLAGEGEGDLEAASKCWCYGPRARTTQDLAEVRELRAMMQLALLRQEKKAEERVMLDESRIDGGDGVAAAADG